MDRRIALFLLATHPVHAVPARASTADAFEREAAVPQKLLDPGCVLYDRLGFATMRPR